MLFDSNYHDGFAAAGGLITGLIVAAVIFRAIWKKLSTWEYRASDQSSWN
jgi:membrane associated rhomboid family serine protease